VKAARLILLLFLVICLSGCWGSIETDEMAYALVMGVDKGPDDNIIVTLHFANPAVVAGQVMGGGGGRDQPFVNTSIVSGRPVEAFNLTDVQLSRVINLMHTSAFIFSEELAREGLYPYIAGLKCNREPRGPAAIYISRGRAGEFIEKNVPVLENNRAKLFQLFSRKDERHALQLNNNLHGFYMQMKSGDRQPYAPMLAMTTADQEESGVSPPGKTGDYLAGNVPLKRGVPQFIGTAVFRGDRMVGQLSGNESMYLNMLTGEFRRGMIVIEDPQESGQKVGLFLYQGKKPQVKVNLESGVPVIDVELFQEPEISGITSNINYESPELKPVLEEALEEVIKNGCDRLVARTQEEFRSDVFGFGRFAKMKFLTVQDWEDYNWSEAYPAATVNINVNLSIKRTGQMIKNMPVKE